MNVILIQKIGCCLVENVVFSRNECTRAPLVIGAKRSGWVSCQKRERQATPMRESAGLGFKYVLYNESVGHERWSAGTKTNVA